MRATRGTDRRESPRPAGREARLRLAIEAGMLAFLVGLALIFVTNAPC